MRKIAITTLLAGGLLLSAGAFAQGAAQSEPAPPASAQAMTHMMKHETKHQEMMESKHKEMMEKKHEKMMDHKKTWHPKKAVHHETKKTQHHEMKKAAPAPARSGG